MAGDHRFRFERSPSVRLASWRKRRDQELDGIDARAQQHIVNGIDLMVGELLAEFGGEAETGRRNELKNEFRSTLNRIARTSNSGGQSPQSSKRLRDCSS